MKIRKIWRSATSSKIQICQDVRLWFFFPLWMTPSRSTKHLVSYSSCKALNKRHHCFPDSDRNFFAADCLCSLGSWESTLANWTCFPIPAKAIMFTHVFIVALRKPAQPVSADGVYLHFSPICYLKWSYPIPKAFFPMKGITLSDYFPLHILSIVQVLILLLRNHSVTYEGWGRKPGFQAELQ